MKERQMMFRLCASISIFLTVTTLSMRTAAAEQPLVICITDETTERQALPDTPPVLDFWHGLFAEALKNTDYKPEFVTLPHRRCEFESTQPNPSVDIVTGRVDSQERRKNFWMVPVYSSHSIVLYPTEKYPDGLRTINGDPVRSLSDLNDLRVCGFNGWAYEYYREHAGFPADWEPLKINLSLDEALIERAAEYIRAGRCDALELSTRSFTNMSSPDILEGVGCHNDLSDRPDVMYMMISRENPHGDKLALTMYQVIAELNEDRIVADLLRKAHNFEIAPMIPERFQICTKTATVGLTGGY